MDISDTMKQTLQSGTAKASRVSGCPVTSGWRMEFWRPLDAALHLGTPPQSRDPIKSAPFGDPIFID